MLIECGALCNLRSRSAPDFFLFGMHGCLACQHRVGPRPRGSPPFARKIKLKASGYRLAYEVIDQEIYILVIAIGKREKNVVYKKTRERK